MNPEPMNNEFQFETRFEALTRNRPFPWQKALYDRFTSDRADNIPPACSIPTGLGKTSVVAVWLIALAAYPHKMPRRLVYVVNRRTVVDQTTNEVERLRENIDAKPKLSGLRDALNKLCAAAPNDNQPPLAISTLRGQYADNREWSADPSRPAVICGTVDMIGSRLLFSGYGVGFRARPLHAGFLGQDVLLVHDEAHLEPAFQKLIMAIQHEQERCKEFTGFHVMELTATTRSDNDGTAAPITLGKEDRDHPVVKQRIEAAKYLRLHQAKDDSKIAEEIAHLALERRQAKDKDGNPKDAAVLLFVRTLDDIKKVCDKLTDKKSGVGKDHVQQLTGTMRGLERDHMADPRRPDASRVFARFLTPPKPDAPEDEQWLTEPMPGAVYLVCTSAGEVGIDISADHMVCDLSTFESMAQRLGRVNRYGERTDTHVDVLHPAKFDDKDKLTPARKATLELLGKLDGDASPKALGDLMASLTEEQRQAAFAPEPIILPATDILFDAWSLTSIRRPIPGRPPVEPYLHGIAEWQPPETRLAWREEVEVITGDLLERHKPEDLLDDYPLKPHELLRDRSDRVFKHLEALSKRHADKPVWVVEERGAIEVTTLAELADKQRKDRINGCTVLLPPSIGGLTADGTLDGSTAHDANHPNGYDVADDWRDEKGQPRRMRLFSNDRRPDGPEGMALIDTIDTDPDADERDDSEADAPTPATDDVQESASPKRGRFWHWYARPRDADDATRASIRPVTWDNHTCDVVRRTTGIVNALKLDDDLKQAVTLAAELHDLGKKREQWQRSIGNPNPTDWHAKPGKPDNGPRWRPQHLNDYRHEFGSLLDVPTNERFEKLGDEMKDLVLHLIAAHHGRARPHFDPDEAFDPGRPSSEADALAIETPRRFARLQRKHGRWGLAYLESLLRAADWAASAAPSAYADEPETKP